jgi:hypothetical protein
MSLSIVLFNTDGDDGVDALDRQDCMGYVLNEIRREDEECQQDLFVLCQDKINGKKHDILCEKMGMSNSVQKRGTRKAKPNVDAEIYHRERENGTAHYTVERVDVGELQRVQDSLKYEADSVFTHSRLTACILTSRSYASGDKILLVSWHGPHNKARLDVKMACFCELVRFVEKLRVECACSAAVVGGDFNMNAEDARRCRVNPQATVLDNYDPTADRENNPLGKIDVLTSSAF